MIRADTSNGKVKFVHGNLHNMLVRSWGRGAAVGFSFFRYALLRLRFVVVLFLWFLVFGSIWITWWAVTWTRRWRTAAAATIVRRTGWRRWAVTIWWARWAEIIHKSIRITDICYSLAVDSSVTPNITQSNSQWKCSCRDVDILAGCFAYLFFRLRFDLFSSFLLSLDRFEWDSSLRCFCNNSSFRKPVNGVK